MTLLSKLFESNKKCKMTLCGTVLHGICTVSNAHESLKGVFLASVETFEAILHA